MLGAHAALLVWTAAHNGVTVDEVGHLPAGLFIWQFGTFDLYRVNPPLTRALAALPLAIASPKTDWRLYGAGLLARPE
ncbi:MAG TPA: hypothetical protein VND64_15295 [Pirellulales bacterium]|nr:hypothetical protein [Pirellulales bacterium]